MKKKNSTCTGSGVGFTGLLTIVFIVMKLMGYINWAWIWVFSPLWIGLAISIVCTILIVIIKKKKRRDFFKPRKGH